MSLDFTRILPGEVTAKKIVYHLDAQSTLALLYTCSTALDIVQHAAVYPQKEISLAGNRINDLGEELTVAFAKEDQTITALLLQKKKVDLLMKNPKLLYPISQARAAVTEGHGDPNDIKELCKYANHAQDASVIVPLILFDVTSNKVEAYNLSNVLREALVYPQCITLTQIIIHHAKQQHKDLQTQDICNLLKLLAEAKKRNETHFLKPDLVPKLLSLLKAKNPQASYIAELMLKFIQLNHLELFNEMLSMPNAEKIYGEKLRELLIEAIKSKNPAFVETLFLHPRLDTLPNDDLAKVLKENNLQGFFEDGVPYINDDSDDNQDLDPDASLHF